MTTRFLALINFTRKYVTVTDFVMGSLFVGGFFVKPCDLGSFFIVDTRSGFTT